MRVLNLLFIFLFPALVQAQACQVYGITDSPQTLKCSFPSESVRLRCVKGKYFLDQVPVSMAFHYDVEEGTVPLVFRTPKRTLVVMMDRPITAELEGSNPPRRGRCTQ